MTDKTMTLEQVRDQILNVVNIDRDQLADAITRHLSQPAERGEAVGQLSDVAIALLSDGTDATIYPASPAMKGHRMVYTAPPPAAERGDAVAEVVIGVTRCYSDDEWYREVTAAGICFLAPLDQQDAAISLIGRGIKPRTAPPPAAGVPDAEPPLAGRWHHGNGYICCGSFRIAREDWEAGVCSAGDMREQVMEWMCASLNAATPSIKPFSDISATPSPTINVEAVRELIKDWRVMARTTGNKYERESLAMCADKLARAIEDAK